jgi:23S rRNA pseudouridine2605 synthase
MATSSSKRTSAKPSGSASGRRGLGKREDRPAATRKSKGPSASADSPAVAPAKRSPRPDPDKTSKKTSKRKSSRSKPIHDHTASPRDEQDGVRLQKYLASAGVASRRAAETLITAGHVQVNGRVIRELGTRVFGDRDRVTVRGEPIRPEAKVYYVLNKPDATVSSAVGSVDERGRPTVLSLMHGIKERLYPVGRLDYHSRGVLLLTNDGELAEALTHPRHGVIKTYHVKFQGKLDDADEQALREGVELDDGAITRPLAELFAFRETGSNVWYQIGLTEGLNRQLRRMGDAIGHPVLKLIRVAIGDITADGLDEGHFRPLKPTEVAQLLAAVRIAPEPSRKRKAGHASAGESEAGDKPTRAKKPSRPRAAGAGERASRPRAAAEPAEKRASAKKATSRPTTRPSGVKKTSRPSSAKPTARPGAKKATKKPSQPPAAEKPSQPPAAEKPSQPPAAEKPGRRTRK